MALEDYCPAEFSSNPSRAGFEEPFLGSLAIVMLGALRYIILYKMQAQFYLDHR